MYISDLSGSFASNSVNFYENRSIALVIIENLFESCLLSFLFSFPFARKF